MVTRPNKTTAPAVIEEQPAGTKRVAQVLRSFGHRSEEDRAAGKDHEWITPTTPADAVAAIPAEVLEAHAKSGFVRFVNVPVDSEVAPLEDARPAEGGQ